MCGRFTLILPAPDLGRIFGTPPPDFDIPPSYNVAPTQEIPIVIEQEDGRHIRKYHWGMVPFWAKETAVGSRMINARVETLAAKPAFRAAFRNRRCLIPASGFYEWKGKAGAKQPFYFTSASGEALAFAGLYESWKGKNAPSDAEPYRSCAIITTDADDSVKGVHDRMPLILRREAYDEWLNPGNREPAGIEAIIKSAALGGLRSHPVSKLVNQVGNNSEDLIKAL